MQGICHGRKRLRNWCAASYGTIYAVSYAASKADASQEKEDTNDHTVSPELHDGKDDTINEVHDDDESGAYRAMASGDKAEKDDLQNGEEAGDEC
ncbi:hypothetical protein GN958_ATG17801 [Phytophthora infestans]|uniref:Uncharacterized protein n=1 Tax=Phytophthora infestans TaxID=4787 RepID=A0A8S9TWB0_PHYIN|nr:hypothetical protein GN958_ATG17801 [Phytophthora infestans]